MPDSPLSFVEAAEECRALLERIEAGAQAFFLKVDRFAEAVQALAAESRAKSEKAAAKKKTTAKPRATKPKGGVGKVKAAPSLPKAVQPKKTRGKRGELGEAMRQDLLPGLESED